MAIGAGRRVGAALMVLGAAGVLAGLMTITDAVEAGERQLFDLDASEERAAQTFTAVAWGAAYAAAGVALFLLALLPYGVSAHRLRKRGMRKEPVPAILAGIAALAILFAALFGFLAPTGPYARAAAILEGGGGAAGAVQIETFEGNLTAAAVADQRTAENVHPFTPVAPRGAVKVRLGYGGEGFNPTVIGVLEAADGSGGWREVGRTDGASDSEFVLPVATYPGDLRLRVFLAAPSVGVVQYMGGISFDPE